VALLLWPTHTREGRLTPGQGHSCKETNIWTNIWTDAQKLISDPSRVQSCCMSSALVKLSLPHHWWCCSTAWTSEKNRWLSFSEGKVWHRGLLLQHYIQRKQNPVLSQRWDLQRFVVTSSCLKSAGGGKRHSHRNR